MRNVAPLIVLIATIWAGTTLEMPLSWAKKFKVVRLELVSMDRAHERLTLQSTENLEEGTSFVLYSTNGKKIAQLEVLNAGNPLKARVTKVHRPELLKRGASYKTRLDSGQSRTRQKKSSRRSRDRSSGRSKEGAKESARMRRPLGASVVGGQGAEPFLGVVGLNLSYSVTDWVKLSAAYGIWPGATFQSFGGGIKFYVPGWSISPVVGSYFGMVMWQIPEAPSESVLNLGFDCGTTLVVAGNTCSNTTFYFPMGIEAQFEAGWNLSVMVLPAALVTMSGEGASGILFSAGLGYYW